MTNKPQMSLVNMAARQRMLSQRMVLQTVLAFHGEELQLENAVKALQLFSESQIHLEDYNRHDDKNVERGNVIKNAYRGVEGVGPRIDEFRSTMERTLAYIRGKNPKVPAYMEKLIEQNDSVLDALNMATAAFDKIADMRDRDIRLELGNIVGSIQYVAKEAKVVSFNTRIMAARAGENGKEFNVVAQRLIDITERINHLSHKAMALVGASA